MEKNGIRGLRNIVVVGFSIIGMLLVMAIWVEQYRDTGESQSDYIRSTYIMPTSEGIKLTLTALPTSQGQGQGQGGGEHGEGEGREKEITPSPTATFDIGNWTPDPEDSAELLDE